MDNYRLALKNRWQYAFAMGTFSTAPTYAFFRWINGGWERPFGGFEYNILRKIPGAIVTAAVTAPLSVPFEIARMTFYADKTFPKELQRGYTSYFNALRRIPFEEGPYWLFKNSFPIYFRNFLSTLTMFYTYDFLKDKCSFMWRVGDMPFPPVKAFLIGFSAWISLVFSYPFAETAK